MVTFVCYHCDRTLKKKQVDNHIRFCGKPVKLACIDCKKWFDEAGQKAHISCISEEEMWHGQFYKKKGSGQPQGAENGAGGVKSGTNGVYGNGHSGTSNHAGQGHRKKSTAGSEISDTKKAKAKAKKAPTDDVDDWDSSSEDEHPTQKVEPWNGWKTTIRRIVKYAPGGSLPKSQVMTRVSESYTKAPKTAIPEKLDHATVKAKINEKIKKLKCLKEDGGKLHYIK